ncbi:MAG: hypothetical protein KQA41_00265 [Candidatus Aenigmarchaeota archaeon]|nr:hypothetical protein [Candidatus Aenigmarchaeota archaeon]
MKGISRSIIISLIFLIVVMLFLVLAFTIFNEKVKEIEPVLNNIFKKALKVN